MAQRPEAMAGRPGPARLREVATLLGFALAFIALDWLSFIRPWHGLNITAWNPQPALAVALLWRRPRAWPVVLLALLLSELLVRGLPVHGVATAASALGLTLAYAALARVLQRLLAADEVLGSRRQLTVLTASVAVASVVNGVVYLTPHLLSAGAPRPWSQALGRYWVGDCVGMMVLLPMLMALLHPPQRERLRRLLTGRDGALALMFIAAALAAVMAAGAADQLGFFHLLLLPVVFASARAGLPGALLSAAVTQGGLLVVLFHLTDPDLTVFEVQTLMATITMTGLMLGVAVDERRQAADELRRSLRLAAAGRLTAALAHELNQPLTALNTYAHAIERMVAASPPPAGPLQHAAQQLGVEAMRAGQVARGLRDFFQRGSSELLAQAPTEWLPAMVDRQRPIAAHRGVALTLELPAGLPAVMLDAVQIGVVLRNLLDNAVDAAAAAPAPHEVSVRAGMSPDGIQVEVTDSGHGFRAGQEEAVFDAGGSGKPGGMGIGLGLSRAIVEAHGGRLWAVPGACGHLCFTLPAAASPRTGNRRQGGWDASQDGLHRR
jgi:two-component system, LuxR family, sensor kinase FixL